VPSELNVNSVFVAVMLSTLRSYANPYVSPATTQRTVVTLGPRTPEWRVRYTASRSTPSSEASRTALRLARLRSYSAGV